MAVTNTLTYYDTAKITAVKSSLVQAPGCKGLPGTNALAYLASSLVKQSELECLSGQGCSVANAKKLCMTVSYDFS